MIGVNALTVHLAEVVLGSGTPLLGKRPPLLEGGGVVTTLGGSQPLLEVLRRRGQRHQQRQH